MYRLLNFATIFSKNELTRKVANLYSTMAARHKIFWIKLALQDFSLQEHFRLGMTSSHPDRILFCQESQETSFEFE